MLPLNAETLKFPERAKYFHPLLYQEYRSTLFMSTMVTSCPPLTLIELKSLIVLLNKIVLPVPVPPCTVVRPLTTNGPDCAMLPLGAEAFSVPVKVMPGMVKLDALSYTKETLRKEAPLSPVMLPAPLLVFLT